MMTLTNEQIVNAFNLFKGLNGYEQLVESNGNKSVLLTPYQFEGSTCWNIAKNLNILRKLVTAYEKSRLALVSTYSIVDQVEKNDPVKLEEFKLELRKLLSQEVEVKGLLNLKISELNLSKNPIQPGVLADLADFLVEN